MRNSKGFTLIELVVVLVILGILAAVAVPRFIDLSAEATEAAVKGQAAAIGSGFAINLAGERAGAGDSVAVTSNDCTVANVDLVMEQFDNNRWQITDPGAGNTPEGLFTILPTDGTASAECAVSEA